MSDLTHLEKHKFERLFGMDTGYILDFSNRSFQDFVRDSTGRDIYDSCYAYDSGSKANRLRGFWQHEENHVVGKLMANMLAYIADSGPSTEPEALQEACQQIVARLQRDSSVVGLDALTAISDEGNFDILAKAIKDTLEKGEPEAGLDRLHTFVVSYVRKLCLQRGIDVEKKPLHSLFGEYIKVLRSEGGIEAAMTERILKSSISVLESFNDVRNDRSFAHDNPILNHDEALLIFNHIVGLVRFLRSLDEKRQRRQERVS